MPEQIRQTSQREDLVIGRGPVQELFRTGRPVDQVLLQKGLAGSAMKIASMAKERGIPCKEVDSRKLDALCGHANHQGVVAQIAAAEYSELEDIFSKANAQGEPVLLVIADEIEDPHNLGAIIRTAEAVGAHGVVIPKRRSAGLSFTVSKSSAGASLHLPVARVSNLAQTISDLKERGVWVYAADMDGTPWCAADYSGPAAVVIGSEGKGVGRLIKERCDTVVSLPMRGKMSSLNASVAAGVLLYEIARQRMGLKSFYK